MHKSQTFGWPYHRAWDWMFRPVSFARRFSRSYEAPSLLTRIRAARDGGEVESLLVAGEGFKGASADTRRKWAKAAENKRRYFAQGNANA